MLFEGNLSHNIDSDYTHGNAIYLTFFRNYLTGQRQILPIKVACAPLASRMVRGGIRSLETLWVARAK